MAATRVVLATRPTALQRVLERHGTLGQARFFLHTRGLSLEELQLRQQQQDAAVAAVDGAIPSDWRRARVQRHEFDRFLFEPEDVVVAVGQDGLVANLAKYLTGQPVVGVNPSPDWFDGVLVRHRHEVAGEVIRAAAAGEAPLEQRTMVEARLDDGQRLLALNEVFVGHRTHQSARYRIRFDGRDERHSSSGLIVATGTGATGWARSIHGARRSALHLPGPTDPRLAFLVREPFPSQATGTSIQEGVLRSGAALELQSEMDEDGVLFGDGIETDRVELPWGTRVSVRCAERALCLVV